MAAFACWCRARNLGRERKQFSVKLRLKHWALRYEDVTIAQPDTTEVPNSGPTVASRTVMVVGKLVESAARGIQQTLTLAGLLGDSYSADEFRAACRSHIAAHGQLRSWAQYEPPPDIFWDDQAYRGEAYAAYSWAVYVAEVAVDLTTYSVSVNDFVALQEVGRVLHPVLAVGQIVGGVAQGIGFALYEKVIWQQGRMQNSQMTNYIMPTSSDLPPIRVFFEELGNVHGAFGAKGIGELPMDGPAPAILNAVEDALGIRFDSIPLLPEDIFEAITARSLANESDVTGASSMSSSLKHGGQSEISLTVNGERKTVLAFPMERLLDVLREQLGLTGAKEGCGEGECGSCSVLMDGTLVNSCLVPVLQAEGAAIVTIEGLASRTQLQTLQEAFLECGGAQCGICTPGMILAALHLLNKTPGPTLEEIKEGLSGNLCRCTGYVQIFEAIARAAQRETTTSS